MFHRNERLIDVSDKSDRIGARRVSLSAGSELKGDRKCGNDEEVF